MTAKKKATEKRTESLEELERELQSPEILAADERQRQVQRQHLAKGVREHRRILALSREHASRQVRQRTGR